MKKFAIFFLILVIIILGVSSVLRTHRGSNDFDAYYYAAKRIAAGSLVYQEQEGISPYIYPPFFASLIAPLTVFNIETVSAIWYLLNIVLFCLCLLLCCQLIFNNTKIYSILKSFPLILRILFLIIITAIFLDNISMLQVNILIFFTVLSGLYLFKEKRDILAGLFLALAISIKVIPLLFLIYFLIKREFKICASILVGLLIFSIIVPSFYLGWDNAWLYIVLWADNVLFKSTSLIPNYDVMDTMFNPGNQSVTAFLSRWLIKNDYYILWWKNISYEYLSFMMNWTLSLTKETVVYIAKIVTILLAGITFTRCFKKIKNRANPMLNYEYALILLLSLILSPIVRTHYFILTIFPLLILFSFVNNKRYRFFYLSFLGFAFLYLSQGMRIFKIFGTGAISILWLWSFILIKSIRQNRQVPA